MYWNVPRIVPRSVSGCSVWVGSVDDPAFVRLVERIRDLDAEAEHLLRRERSLFEPLGERLPFEELHDEVLDAVGVADVVEGADVRMRELGDRFRLALEAGLEVRVRREVGREDFHRDGAPEPRVIRPVDLSHAAGTKG